MQTPGETFPEALAKYHEKIERCKPVIDVGFHIGVTDLHDGGTLDDLAKLPDEGVTSYKLFMAYKGAVMVDDETLFRTMEVASETGALVMVHAENGDAIDVLVKKAVAEGKTEPIWHARTRPPITEGEATNRAIQLARVAGLPALRRPRLLQGGDRPDRPRAGRGLAGVGRDLHAVPLHRRDGARSRTSRAASTSTRRRRGRRRTRSTSGTRSRTDVLSVVSTDHCPFNWDGQKTLGKDDFSKIPNGGPGIENRLHMLHHFGVREGRISWNRFVELVSTNVAKFFGLYPRKGTIAPGSDADIVVWDPEKRAHDLGVDAPLERRLQPVRGHRGHRRTGGRARARSDDRRGRRARRPAGRRPVRQARALRRGAHAAATGRSHG